MDELVKEESMSADKQFEDGMIDEWIQAFQQEPLVVMDRPLEKDIVSSTDQNPIFVEENTEERIAASDEIRQRFLLEDEDAEARAAYTSNDHVRHLVDEFDYITVHAMHRDHLTQARLAESPWSGDYWPICTGLLGNRYADPAFPGSLNWESNFNYVEQHAAKTIWNQGDDDKVDQLSPAEKYDLLVGDDQFTLTRRMWETGKKKFDQLGYVPGWMGICNGWSCASYMFNRPVRTIEVQAADGRSLRFFPSDLKALGSLLWANGKRPTRFIGGRCNISDPEKDPLSGRVIASQCFDTNPGTFHLAMVNQLGISRRSLIMDATFDYQVWNQPVYSYHYSYFNPSTGRKYSTPDPAKIRMSDFANDKFKQYRSSNAHDVVGIHMQVEYMVETKPNHFTTDSAERDAIHKVDYRYDLELDERGRTIGGEWYTNKHPDFLWTPAKNARVKTRYEDNALGHWNSQQAMPHSWQTAARHAAYYQRCPLGKVMEKLFDLAS